MAEGSGASSNSDNDNDYGADENVFVVYNRPTQLFSGITGWFEPSEDSEHISQQFGKQFILYPLFFFRVSCIERD